MILQEEGDKHCLPLFFGGVILKNLYLKMQYPNRPTRKFIFSREEFESYIRLDNKIARVSKEKYGLVERSVTELHNESPYIITVIKLTDSPVVTDHTLDRLDLALFWSDNETITRSIAQAIADDAGLNGSEIDLSSIEKINQTRKRKIDYIYSISRSIKDDGYA